MGKAICQIVDSSGSLPRAFLRQHDIAEVPFYFKFDAPDYSRENVDLTVDAFYAHMEEYPDEVPHTACPNVYDWLTVFEAQAEKGAKSCIVTTISSKLSGSYEAALSAKKLFDEEHGDIRLEVIDSNTCACGQAALEIGIAKMIAVGMPFEELISAVRGMAAKTTTLFTVGSLKYMRAGGRIGGAAAFIGTLIHLRPICEFVEGVVHPIKAAPGRKNSLTAMADVAIGRIRDAGKLILVVQNARCQADAGYIMSYLREKTGFAGQIFSGDLGITVGAHSGPGAIGIGYVEDPLI
ncbi:MAG TPA: DegV family protein [Candidatus Acidoferrum sp.]|nr:DegV family protein [Candidatus Acidoferrum sp.]